jgi:Tol biopolymer transport system component
MTQAGVILGTASYMSPEQAKGRAVDKRSDVWAFGAVLYEMLTGTRPFDGEDITDVLGAVVRLEPDWSRLPADATAAVRSLVQGCLIKDRRHRVGDMAAALFVLKTSTTLPAPQGQPSSMGTQQVLRIAVTSALGGAAAAGLVAALLVEAGSVGTREAPAEAVVRFTIEPPNDGAVIAAPPAISPDGRRIVIHGSDRSLWLRSLDQVSVQRLSETAGGTQPFWSPDSRSVGFFADGKLKKIDVVGGLPVTLCDVGPNPGGGSWGPQGVILFAPDALSSPIHRVSAEGGVPAPVIRRDSAPGELGHALPYFLPDGRHFFYRQILGDAFIDRTRIGSLEEPVDAEVGLPGDSNALYANGALLFVRGTTLLQQPFDAAKLATSGHPTPIAENVVLGIGNTGSFDVSRTGTLIYFAAPQRRLQIAWVDRQARLTPLPLPPGRYGDPALSPDGRQIALAVTDETGQNIWVYDLERGTFGKRTFEGDNELPLWSRDGEHLVFSTAVRRGPLMIVRADGSGPPEPLITSEQRFGLKVATSWSADGGLMVFQSDQDIFVRGNDGSLQPAVATPASEREGRFAPTGPWLAYSSNETGRREVYVQSFPTGRGKRMISTDGGAQPMWAPGGGELFYKSGNRMMVVSVKAGATFEPLGTPRVLFEMPMPDRTVGDAARFVVSPDAKRFLVLTPAPGDAPSRPSLNVILNWPALVKATAP